MDRARRPALPGSAAALAVSKSPRARAAAVAAAAAAAAAGSAEAAGPAPPRTAPSHIPHGPGVASGGTGALARAPPPPPAPSQGRDSGARLEAETSPSRRLPVENHLVEVEVMESQSSPKDGVVSSRRDSITQPPDHLPNGFRLDGDSSITGHVSSNNASAPIAASSDAARRAANGRVTVTRPRYPPSASSFASSSAVRSPSAVRALRQSDHQEAALKANLARTVKKRALRRQLLRLQERLLELTGDDSDSDTLEDASFVAPRGGAVTSRRGRQPTPTQRSRSQGLLAQAAASTGNPKTPAAAALTPNSSLHELSNSLTNPLVRTPSAVAISLPDDPSVARRRRLAPPSLPASLSNTSLSDSAVAARRQRPVHPVTSVHDLSSRPALEHAFFVDSPPPPPSSSGHGRRSDQFHQLRDAIRDLERRICYLESTDSMDNAGSYTSLLEEFDVLQQQRKGAVAIVKAGSIGGLAQTSATSIGYCAQPEPHRPLQDSESSATCYSLICSERASQCVQESMNSRTPSLTSADASPPLQTTITLPTQSSRLPAPEQLPLLNATDAVCLPTRTLTNASIPVAASSSTITSQSPLSSFTYLPAFSHKHWPSELVPSQTYPPEPMWTWSPPSTTDDEAVASTVSGPASMHVNVSANGLVPSNVSSLAARDSEGGVCFVPRRPPSARQPPSIPAVVPASSEEQFLCETTFSSFEETNIRSSGNKQVLSSNAKYLTERSWESQSQSYLAADPRCSSPPPPPPPPPSASPSPPFLTPSPSPTSTLTLRPACLLDRHAPSPPLSPPLPSLSSEAPKCHPSPLDHVPAAVTFEPTRQTQVRGNPIINAALVGKSLETCARHLGYATSSLQRSSHLVAKIPQLAPDAISSGRPAKGAGKPRSGQDVLPSQWDRMASNSDTQSSSASSALYRAELDGSAGAGASSRADPESAPTGREVRSLVEQVVQRCLADDDYHSLTREVRAALQARFGRRFKVTKSSDGVRYVVRGLRYQDVQDSSHCQSVSTAQADVKSAENQLSHRQMVETGAARRHRTRATADSSPPPEPPPSYPPRRPRSHLSASTRRDTRAAGSDSSSGTDDDCDVEVEFEISNSNLERLVRRRPQRQPDRAEDQGRDASTGRRRQRRPERPRRQPLGRDNDVHPRVLPGNDPPYPL